MNIAHAIAAAISGMIVTFSTPKGKEELRKNKAKDLLLGGRARAYKSTFKGICGAATWRELAR
jgi:hypothetical protein